MTRTMLAAALLALTLLAGCEKYVVEGETDSAESTGQTAKDVINEDPSQIVYLTVAEAQEVELGEVICVRGYVVASCTRSMGNADFMEPFEGSTAIILADEPVDLDDFQYATDDNLFPVCLTDYKEIRAALNLTDNPRLWNRRIYITGVKSTYMRCPGLKKVLRYQIAD